MMYKPYKLGLHNPNLTFREKLRHLNFTYFILISLLAMAGVMMLIPPPTADGTAGRSTMRCVLRWGLR